MRRIRSRSLLFLGLLTALSARAAADVRLPAVFGDHMVLQADLAPSVFGWAEPGEDVTVSMYVGDGVRLLQEGSARADAGGRFRIRLQPLAPGDLLRIEVRGSNTIVLRDVLVGEVWIASGQSNMEWPVSQSAGAEEELAAPHAPKLRIFQVQRAAADGPAADVVGVWREVDAESLANFSAVAYSFGRELAARVPRPVGLIQAAWGGTPAEAWTERSFLEGSPDFAAILARRPERAASRASTLFNGMIAPLSGLRVRGVIWYQGESNADRAEQYRTLFPALIRSWRAAFTDPELAFVWVQLANFRARAEQPGESEWAELREAQSLALELPRTGMVSAIDVGDAEDIHPRDKRTVGERLASVARAIVYGQSVESSGPTFREFRREGAELVLAFDHAAGLRTRDGAAPLGFAVAAADGEFQWADARIADGEVRLHCAGVPEPMHVRYAWADNPAVNLVNAAGLPALPFRTDRRPPVTAGRR